MMDVCRRIEDIVWSESEHVWKETFSLLKSNKITYNALVNVVMKWIIRMIAEYEIKHTKISDILDKMTQFHEGVHRLKIHHARIISRFKSAYSCCTLVDQLMF